MLISIVPVTVREFNGSRRVLTSLEGAARFLMQGWPGERDRPTYAVALKACLAALEGAGAVEEARDAIVEAASAAGILVD
ncbi:MAG TPA: DUF982 domain-containing protein [Methylovirgula sp.]|jgi:hypothetical protein|nr:DUF982 domain-containing protein [Methylovirgula sp.]